jgi:hypothetical protein
MDVRLDIFPKVRKKILEALQQDKPRLDLLLKAVQGSGKSWFSDQLAVELANLGHNVIIAVNSGDVAREHHERIEAQGGEALVMRSHEATFKHSKDACPDYEEIQYQIKLGVDSRDYKTRFCQNCPLLDDCTFPRQYSRARDEDVKIVIIQHAHFQSKQAMMQLLQNKEFSVMIIDESFIDNLIEIIKPTDFEIEVLKITTTASKWTERLSDWLKIGGEPKGTIRALPEELEELQKIFDDNKQGWRMRGLIDAYNSGEWFNPRSGIKRFSPVPYVPVRLLTDATPTEEELRTVLNTSHLEVVGDGDVLDITAYHPENKIIQVIDSTLSKASLQTDEKFYDFLSFIGDKCTTSFQEDRVLVTVFKDNDKFSWTQETLDFFREKYPHLDVGTDPMVNRIVIDGMKVGVNTYASFTVQFLVCSVYMNDEQIAQGAYQTKVIKNYWRLKEDLPIVQNILVQKDQSILWEDGPVRKIERDGVYEYQSTKSKKLGIRVPVEKYERMTYEKAVGKSQQAVRIRFTENLEKRKIVYIFGNYNFPSLLITHTVLLDDILSELY